jgi:peptide/nickel transport system substrate-binding protein
VVAAATAAFSLGLASGTGARAASPSVLKGAYTSFPDYMDPQLSYTAEGWTAMYDTYIPLLTYRHADGKAGSEVIPGLARRLPKIGDGGRTYTLSLRPGLRYSNGRPVRASDFRYAIERLFRVHSGGAPFYTDIVGARSFARGRRPHIDGIHTDDRTGKIVIHLERPQGAFTDELALLFAAPVPSGSPMRDRSFDPLPATGPYEITSAGPGGWSYVRNPEWQKVDGPRMPQIPDGHVDRIQIAVVRDQGLQVDALEEGRLDWLFDPPPPHRIAEVEEGIDGTQLRVEPTLSTYYFWLNTQRPPFDDPRVRRAVNYAVDAESLSRVYRGQVVPTHQILPPGMPGYEKFDLYPHDLVEARRLIREADPADRRITVWTDGESPNDDAGRYYRGVLEELGFKVGLRILNPDNYFLAIANERTPDLDTGFADWFEDYPHPDDFFAPLLAAKPTSYFDENFSRFVVAWLNRRVASLARRPWPIPAAAYARLDRSFMKLAPIVPYGTRVLSIAFSKAVDLHDFLWNPTFEADLTSFKLAPAPAPRRGRGAAPRRSLPARSRTGWRRSGR